MRKVLTIDCWNTLIKPSGDKERIIYQISKRIGVPFSQLWEVTEQVKREVKEEHHLVPNYTFWFHVKNYINCEISTDAILKVAQEVYNTYKPIMINPVGWSEVVLEAVRRGYTVKILSNTGYLKSEWLEKWINENFEFYAHVPVIGSDLVSAAKPTKEFYKRALDFNFSEDKDMWVHIGDSTLLDIDPVKELGGNPVLFTGWGFFDTIDIKTILI